ncbi:MAG TPA: ATP-binding protein [Acidobacteriaceae bacterium]|nr:ATP-binding protein [Acidobacteriaceae bacterium]
MTRRPTRTRSIAARLSVMNLLVSGIALLLAYVSFVAYDLVNTRQAAVDSLTAEAQIIGANSVTAILYDDQAVAQSTLSALSGTSDVTGAAIYTTSGHAFAQYLREGAAPLQPPPNSAPVAATSWRSGLDVLIASPIVFQGKHLGIVYIQAHFTNLRLQARRFALITAAILLLCLLIGLLVGNVFRRLLSQPIISLARTSRLISRYKDYSLRFEPSASYSELESLTDAFNEMLAEIQQRDAALEQGRTELEHRVEDRTAQLVAANRELESFSYTVAHDLRGPLEIITNICYLLQNPDANDPPEVNEGMLIRLTSSVSNMSSIIDDLLNLSRATSAGLHRKQLDLSNLACTLLEDLTAAHPERDVKTSVQLGCHANADKGLIQIVLQNLLRNAWKFTSRTQSAQIEFGCIRQEAEQVFFVRDNGAGFDQHMASRLFKPFERLHAESDFSGTGIGLATVQRVIDRHGGRIWAHGEVAKGATFYFTLGNPTS